MNYEDHRMQKDGVVMYFKPLSNRTFRRKDTKLNSISQLSFEAGTSEISDNDSI